MAADRWRRKEHHPSHCIDQCHHSSCLRPGDPQAHNHVQHRHQQLHDVGPHSIPLLHNSLLYCAPPYSCASDGKFFPYHLAFAFGTCKGMAEEVPCAGMWEQMGCTPIQWPMSAILPALCAAPRCPLRSPPLTLCSRFGYTHHLTHTNSITIRHLTQTRILEISTLVTAAASACIASSGQ